MKNSTLQRTVNHMILSLAHTAMSEGRLSGVTLASVLTAAGGAVGAGVRNLSGSFAWAGPSVPLAVAAAATTWLAAAKGKLWRYASTALAGIGFMISGWAGLATVTFSLAYALSSRARKRRRPRAFAGLLLALPAAGGAIVYGADPDRIMGMAGRYADSAARYSQIGLLVTIGLAIVLAALALIGKAEGNVPVDPVRSFPQWIKDAKLKEQKGRCAYWDEGCRAVHNPEMGAVLQADHIVPWAQGGRTEKENCQMLCQPHNRMKSQLTDKAARALARKRLG